MSRCADGLFFGKGANSDKPSTFCMPDNPQGYHRGSDQLPIPVHTGSGSGASTAAAGAGVSLGGTSIGGTAAGGSNFTTALQQDLGIVFADIQPFLGLAVLLAVIYFLAKAARHLK